MGPVLRHLGGWDLVCDRRAASLLLRELKPSHADWLDVHERSLVYNRLRRGGCVVEFALVCCWCLGVVHRMAVLQSRQ